jgi:anti-sigma-K factor RskA
MSEGRHGELASYLLGELDAEAQAAFERRLAEEPELREEVERLRPLVVELEGLPAEAWELPEAPPLRMPEAPAAPRRRRPSWWRRSVPLRPALAAALALGLFALGVGAGTLLEGDESSPAPDSEGLVLRSIDDGPAGARGRVLITGPGQSLAAFSVSGLRPTGPGRFYELWLLDDGGRMIALGTFRVGGDGSAEIELPIPVPPSRYRYFDVSLQADDGDPTHSGISVLRGPTAS